MLYGGGNGMLLVRDDVCCIYYRYRENYGESGSILGKAICNFIALDNF